VPAGIDRDPELGADAVGRGDQDRILEAGGLQVEQPAEAAEIGVGAGAAGGGGQRLDGLDQRLARVDVDAGVTVGEGSVGAIGGAYGVLRRAAV